MSENNESSESPGAQGPTVLTDEPSEEILAHTKQLMAKIEASEVVMSLWTDNLDAKQALELAAALLYDKAIYFAVKRGAQLPQRLRRLASGTAEWETQEELAQIARTVIEYGQSAFQRDG